MILQMFWFCVIVLKSSEVKPCIDLIIYCELIFQLMC